MSNSINMTMEQWQADLASTRRAALEQAAKVCADYAEHLHKNGAGWSAGHIIAEECERKIRALLEPSDER